MKGSIRCCSVIAILAALLVVATAAMAASSHNLATAPAGNGNANPGIAPPNSNPLGETYARWGAAWWQWIFSLPRTNHPFFGSGLVDCSYGQKGTVWFLVGNFSGGTVSRTCDVPVGTRLFIPVYNAWADNTGTPPPLPAWQELADFVKAMVDAGVVHASIDGVSVRNLSAYRAAYAPFEYDLAKSDNLLSGDPFNLQIPGSGWPSLHVSPAASDGYWLMLEPLPPGKHEINFGGTASNFMIDITYHITIVPPGRSH